MLTVKSSGSVKNNSFVDERIRAEQVQVVYQQAQPAMFISVLVAGIMCLILWGVTDQVLLVGWLTLISVLAVMRVALVIRFRNRAADNSDITLWERRFVFSLVLTGMAWGIGGWLVMPQESLAHQAIVYFFLMGLVGGAVATYSAHTVCVVVTISAVMLPSTVWFVLQDNLILRGMAAGGVIYVAAAYRATKMLAFFLRRSFQLSHELEIAHESAQRLARTDELTGMKNRRAFYELGELAFKQADRYGHSASVVMLDIDRFKSINDSRGHAAGDQVIKAVADVIKMTVRASDIAGRLGGEEFAILMPETTTEDAALMAERLRRKVSEISVETEGGNITFTASFGVAESFGGSDSLDKLLARADAGLYEAKEAGRDRVICYGRG